MKQYFLVLFHILSVLAFVLSACNNRGHRADNFRSWFAGHYSVSEIHNGHLALKELQVESEALNIDTIYRSMQGPFNVKSIAFNEDEDELVWLRGYSSEIIDAENEKILSDEFMCHNNLEIADKNSFPWKLKTIGSNIRLFTLTEGQTKIQLPPGYGIPFLSSEKVSLFSQVLNHNAPNLHLKVKHRVMIEYIRQADLAAPLVPLYQQAVFITRQFSGPEGNYGESPTDISSVQNGNDANKPCDKQCCVRYDKNTFNPYADNYGRAYTGHWELPYGNQILKTDVTRMLDLPYDTRVHFIGVHVHPFAVSLQLRDATIDSLLFNADVKNFTNKIGIEKISSYSSAAGIPLYQSHRYELVSEYHCSDSTAHHTAMATMFLYLEDEK